MTSMQWLAHMFTFIFGVAVGAWIANRAAIAAFGRATADLERDYKLSIERLRGAYDASVAKLMKMT